jgi:type I restriction enzyme S subunit
MSQEQIQVPKGWKLTTLDEVCIKISDRDHTTPNYTKSGISLISPKDFTPTGISFLNCKFISKDDHRKNSKRTDLKKGDILFSRIGTVGETRLVDSDKEFSILHSIVQIRPDLNKISQKFLYYFLQSGELLRAANIGIQSVGTPDLGIKKIRSFKIFLPPLVVQKKIVQKLDDVLGQLEEKKKAVFSIIEQNKEKIDFFEKNFLSEIMKKHLKIGNYPKTWNVKTIGELTNRIGGGTPSKSNEKYYQGNICWITISDLSNEITFPKIINDSKMKITEQAINESSTKIIPKDSVVLGTRVGVGKLGIAGEKITTNQDFTSFVCSKELDPYFLACYFLANKQQLRMKSRGVSVKGITTSAVDSFRIGFPSIKEQKQIVQNIKNAEEKFKSQKVQFENIKENYDNSITYVNHIQSSILDAAFSGKLVN